MIDKTYIYFRRKTKYNLAIVKIIYKDRVI